MLHISACTVCLHMSVCTRILFCSNMGHGSVDFTLLCIMAPKMKWHSIKPKMTWPMIHKLFLSFDISIKELPPRSLSIQPEFIEPLLHLSCFLLGPRGLQNVFPVLKEFTPWQEGIREAYKDAQSTMWQSLCSSYSECAQRWEDERELMSWSPRASLCCHHPGIIPASAKAPVPAVPPLLSWASLPSVLPTGVQHRNQVLSLELGWKYI